MFKPTNIYNKNSLITYISIDCIYTAFFSQMEKRFSSKGESHDFYELVYVDNGLIMAEISSRQNSYQTIELNQGTAYLHAPGHFHRHYVNDSMGGSLCIISFECQSPLLEKLAERPIIFTEIQKQYLSSAMSAAFQMFEIALCKDKEMKFFTRDSTDPLLSQKFKNNLELIFLDLLCAKEIPNEVFGRKNHSIIDVTDAVKLYLEDNIYAKVSIETICHHFGYGKTAISTKFKEVSGESIIDYFNRIKIEEAMHLIQNSDDTMTAISEKLQFSSYQYFSKTFKKITNITPKEFKKSIANNSNAKYTKRFTLYNEIPPKFLKNSEQ